MRDLLVASSLVITLAGTAQSFAQSSNPEESARERPCSRRRRAERGL